MNLPGFKGNLIYSPYDSIFITSCEDSILVYDQKTYNLLYTFRKAHEKTGFSIVHTNVLNKTQSSFKQVTTTGSVKGDPIMLLRKANMSLNTSTTDDMNRLIDQLISVAKGSKVEDETSPKRLYSRFVTYYLQKNQEIPIDADTFYRLLKNKLEG